VGEKIRDERNGRYKKEYSRRETKNTHRDGYTTKILLQLACI